ncbi:HAD family hydrolase [Candidatus Poribacteria bacterium]|nr:HAD family hydrolase [Candidatus Poribacteria bacterium]
MHTPATPKPFDGVTAVLLDADDTLWENNLFFLQSVEWLCRACRRFGFTDRATRSILKRWENHHIPILGFGYGSYEVSLLTTLRQICSAHPVGTRHHAGLRQRALQWTHFLRTHPIVLMPGVAEVLPVLTNQYRTIIVTKGDYHDQMGKVHRSGLLPLLHAAEVVPTKKPGEYAEVLRKHGLRREEVVMIGNSPASDINNAKRAGLRTIFVPHPKTWDYEMEPVLLEEPETIHLPDFWGIRHVLRLDG